MNRKRGEGGRFDPVEEMEEKMRLIKQEELDNDPHQQTVTLGVCMDHSNTRCMYGPQ